MVFVKIFLPFLTIDLCVPHHFIWNKKQPTVKAFRIYSLSLTVLGLADHQLLGFIQIRYLLINIQMVNVVITLVIPVILVKYFVRIPHEKRIFVIWVIVLLHLPG